MTIHSPSSYRNAMVRAFARGFTVAGLHATEHGAVVRATLVSPEGDVRLESVAARDGVVPTIVDRAPAAAWDEREAHDLYGVRFSGHEPLRPLVDHDPELARWTVPVRGDDPHQVAVGPIHAGVIESGHFRFHVVGDRILHVDVRLFYKHRGLERAAEGRPLSEAMAFVSRACAGCAVANGVVYAQACELALGLRAPEAISRSRTILLELERGWSHLNDVAAVCAGVGLAAGNARFAALCERMRRLNAALTGHRLLFGTVAVGMSSLELDAAAVRAARDELKAVGAEARSAWRELQFNASFQDRLAGIGVLDEEDVSRLGTVGPAARAVGVREDIRSIAHGLEYEGFTPVTPERAEGDVQARVEQRALELWQSLAILDALLDRPVRVATAEPDGDAAEVGVGRIESPRGATLCVVEHSGGRLDRVHLRTGSYANWPSVAFAAVDNLLPDFPLINKSFELCYACADR